jgi:hypothetical protein
MNFWGSIWVERMTCSSIVAKTLIGGTTLTVFKLPWGFSGSSQEEGSGAKF